MIGSGIHYGLSDVAYHADPVEGGSLSRTGAAKLLSCPAAFKWWRDNPSGTTASFELGKAAHHYVLGTGAPLVSVDAPDWRTKAAQQARDEARSVGAVALLERDYELVAEMAAAMEQHEGVQQLRARGGQPEATLIARDPRTGVVLRCRVDWLPEPDEYGDVTIWDYKTARSADPREFARSAAEYDYALQAVWYSGLVRLTGHARRVHFRFVVQEKTPPYLISVVAINPLQLKFAETQARTAIDTYAYCTETNQWPGYVPEDSVATVSLPFWWELKAESLDPERWTA